MAAAYIYRYQIFCSLFKGKMRERIKAFQAFQALLHFNGISDLYTTEAAQERLGWIRLHDLIAILLVSMQHH